MKKLLSVSLVCLFVLMSTSLVYSLDDPADFNTPDNKPIIPESYDNNSGTNATWTTLTASPHAQSRSFCAMVTIAGVDYIYQFGGGAAALLTNVARYNVSTLTWTNNYSTMPQGISAGSAVVMDDSLLFVFGGNSPTLGFTLKYNYITNTWTQMANMTTPVTDAGCVKHGTNVYLVGGGTGLFGTGYFNTVQVYNTLTNTYSAATNYPVAAGMMGIGIQGDTIITAGGWDGVGGIANAYKGIINSGNPALITWTPIANYPGGAVTRMASAPVKLGTGGGVMFAGGAIGGATLTNTSYIYNMCLGTWENLPNISQARSNFKGASKNGDVAYIVGGFTTVGVGTFERVTFTDITGTCFSSGGGNPPNASLLLPSPGVNTNYVGIPHQASMVGFGNNITIEGWMNVGGFTTANTLLNKGGISFDYQLGLGSTGIPFFRAQGVIATGTGIIVTAGVWTHLAVTYDGTTARFYKDGVLGATVPLAMTLGSSTNELRIGRGNADPGSGNIDEVRLWSVARSEADILADMCKKWPSTFTNNTGLKAVWHMDSTLVDSISGYNGTAFGTIGYGDPASCLVTSVSQIGSEIPERYILSQNYPNPFNPTTTIRFEIPTQSLVTLKVYDITGREVGYLVNEVKNAGVYLVGFNGNNLASGTYFYRIQAGDFVEIKKMVLLK